MVNLFYHQNLLYVVGKIKIYERARNKRIIKS